MTRVKLVQTAQGYFRYCKAEGHSGFAKAGADIVCSAISVLFRTTLKILEDTEGLSVKSNITKRGTLEFWIADEKSLNKSEKLQSAIKNILPKLEGILKYTNDFLVTGLSSLQSEYPGNVEVTIETE
ncbi:MAG: ribosomal-processing cysteine protease Prp [Treponema sp.]|nr:ribosomal-processing cysteine protease Prp [Treponema sp.]